jgi:hypothetical protein
LRFSVRLTAAALWILGFASSLQAAGAPAEGTLSVGGRTYKIGHAVAYATKTADFELVTILASDRNIPTAELKSALAKNGTDENYSPSQPYLRVVFLKTGKTQYCNAWADNSSFSTNSDNLHGELTIDGGRVKGKATLAPEGDPGRQRAFDIRFDVPLGFDAAAPAKSANAAPAKPQVTGKFLGNGKPARLAYVSARPGEPFSGKPSIVLIFTEQDHSRDPRPDIGAGFGKFGSALVISVFEEDGGVFGCEVAHSAHGKQPFSSVGNMRMAEYEVGPRSVSGQLTSDGPREFFEKTWDVDLKFAAPLAAQAKPAAASAPSAAKKPKPAADDGDDEPKPASKTAAKPNARKLPLPTGASGVVYKEIVEQMTFKAPGTVTALSAELSKKLAAGGWKSADDDDLVTPKSAILNRTRGEAKLTIMVKPSGAGSEVTIFGEGLDWDEE